MGYGTAFVYTRVSTDRQTMENQRIQIRKFAEERGLVMTDDGWFEDDAVSGTIAPLKRAGFRDMKETLEGIASEDRSKLPKFVLVYEVSRIGRTFWEILETIRALEEYSPILSTSPKEAFLQTTDRSMRQLLLSILAWAAEREREVLIQRTVEGVSRAHEEKRHSGNIPLGYAQHVCERLNHNRCQSSGKLYLDEVGEKVVGLLKMNPELKAVQAHREMGLKYKEAWNLLNSVKKFGELRL